MSREARKTRSLAPAALIGALFVFFSLAVHGADPVRDYQKGLRAFRAGDYASAATAFRLAASSDSQEGPQKLRVSGVLFEDYFPFYFLGLSLEHMGDSENALAALTESRRQGKIKSVPELEGQLEAAMARLRPSPTPVPRVEQESPPTPTPAVNRLEEIEISPTPFAKAARVPTPAASPLATVPPTPPPVAEDEMIRTGIELFFLGNYDGALVQLGPKASGSPKARLFFALSLAGRILLMPSPDPALLKKARSEYQEALGAGAAIRRRESISPRILNLLEGSSGSFPP